MPTQQFWKIPKEWVQEWGLSPSECLLLADIVEWDCPLAEHAERVGISRKSAYNIVKKLHTMECVKITHTVCKNYTKSVNNLHKNCVKITHSPYNPPYIKDQKDQEDHLAESAPAREATEKFSDKNQTATPPITPTPQPPAPTAPDTVLIKRVSEWEREHRAMITQGSEWANSLYRLYKITNLELNDYLVLFTDHCTAQGEDYKTLSDYRKHLTSWLRYRINDLKKQPNGQSTTQQRQHVTHYDGPADFRP